MKKILGYLIILLVLPLVGNAIITADNTTAETDPFATQGFDWDYIYNYKNASSVAVDSYWILTAGHVGGDNDLTIGTTTYFCQETVYHPTADLALVRFDKALPGYYGLYTGDLYVGDDILMAGYGNTGTVSATSYSDSGSGNGTKRWGSNEIDSLALVNDTYALVAGFVNNDTLYEAGVGDKDSGSGSFINDDGVWKLVGLNFARGPSDPYTDSYMASIPIYESWITQTIPEPTTGIFIAMIVAVFGIVKRTRYMVQ